MTLALWSGWTALGVGAAALAALVGMSGGDEAGAAAAIPVGAVFSALGGAADRRRNPRGAAVWLRALAAFAVIAAGGAALAYLIVLSGMN